MEIRDQAQQLLQIDPDSLPRRSDVYIVFVVWKTLPAFLRQYEREELIRRGYSEEMIDLAELSSYRQFAKHFGVSKDTLTNWTKMPRFSQDVDRLTSRFIYQTFNPAIEHAFAQHVLNNPTAENFKTWKRIYGGYDKDLNPPEKEAEHTEYRADYKPPKTIINFLLAQAGVDIDAVRESYYGQGVEDAGEADEVGNNEPPLPSEQNYTLEEALEKRDESRQHQEEDEETKESREERQRKEREAKMKERAEEEKKKEDRRERIRKALEEMGDDEEDEGDEKGQQDEDQES